MRRLLLAGAIVAVWLPSILSAQQPVAAPKPLESAVVLPQLALGGAASWTWSRCENQSRRPSLSLTPAMSYSPARPSQELDLCGFLCTISCLSQGYFGGFCVGNACHCNGEDQLPSLAASI